MNLYVRYFDHEFLAKSVDEAIEFLRSIPEIKVESNAASRITTEGLGATDKLSDEIDFNRVAMFIDTTKQ